MSDTTHNPAGTPPMVPGTYEALASTLAGVVERQLAAYVGHFATDTNERIAAAQQADAAARDTMRAEFNLALQQHADAVSGTIQAIVPEVQRLLNELNTQVVQRIDTTDHRATDRMLQLEERINEQQGTRIANLEATIGRIGAGFDDAMQALSQRMLVLENQLAATNDTVEAVRQKADSYDDTLFEEVRQQLSSAIGEAMLVRIELDRLAATTDEKIDRATLRMAEIEALLTDEMDVTASVQLERLEELERALTELNPDQFVRHSDPTAGATINEVVMEATSSPFEASMTPVSSPTSAATVPPAPPVGATATPAFSLPSLTLPTLPTLPTNPSASF